MRLVGVGLVIVVLGSGAIMASVRAVSQPSMKPPTERVTDCTNGGCHAQQTDHQFLHGPNAVQACDACHEHVDPAKHTFQLKRPGQQLCNFCHIDKTGREGPVVHKPVADGQCLGCHDPHGANNKRMLKKDTTPELCSQCHKEVLSTTHQHKPATEDCAVCHKPHTSSFERLLTMDRRSLCLSCHEEIGKTISGSTYPHDPANGDCLQCHQPHGSNEIRSLKAAPKDLCLSCHDKVGDKVKDFTHQHLALNDGKSCLNCHAPHGSMHAKQLANDPISTCLKCHKEPIVVSKDRTVAGVPELAMESMHKHGPVAKGDCAACHGVHGADRENLLLANYTTSFYQAYSENAYELCFMCHDKNLILAQPAAGQTKFRDGTRNLHSLHVNSDTQGRSCRACHTIHASKFEAQINETVPFGQWKLPINFMQTETGGSCAPGCHRVQKYDREKPVGLPFSGTSPANPQTPAKAAPQAPSATGGGTSGAGGAAPAGGLPSAAPK